MMVAQMQFTQWKRNSIVLALSTVFLSGCGGGGSHTPTKSVVNNPSTPKEWTYMVYMAADNNLSEAAIADLNEMEKIGSSAHVNIVAQADFSPLYSTLQSTNTQRGLISKDNNPNQVNSLKLMERNVDMGDPLSLIEFVQWAKKTYPAKNYALVLWSHGDGWKTIRSTGGIQKGALQDESAKSYMSFADISHALNQVGDLALINFDACLMGMYEIAYQLRHQAQVLVASPEVEPGTGDPYDLILDDLVKTPTLTASQLGRMLINRYSESYQNSRDTTTKVMYDLSKMDAVHEEIVSLAQLLNAQIDQERLNIQFAMEESLSFDQPGHLDLGTFLVALNHHTDQIAIQNQITRVQQAVAASTTLSLNNTATANPAYQHANGMGIYLPHQDQTNHDDLALYQQLAVSQPAVSWSTLINQLLLGQVSASSKVEGNFAFKLVWDAPQADLDLIVSEPNGDLYAAWQGTTTPNGFFSAESSESGRAEESYTTAAKVDAGDYDVIINYYTHQQRLSPAMTARLLVKDQRSTQFVEQGRVVLDFSQPSPIDADPLLIIQQIFDQAGVSPYSDWYYAGRQNAPLLAPKSVIKRLKYRYGRFNPQVRAARIPLKELS